MIKNIILAIAAALVIGCGKDDEIINPPMSDVPAIELINVSPTTVTAL